jgi:nucleoside-diphosphate-sugar epimerase
MDKHIKNVKRKIALTGFKGAIGKQLTHLLNQSENFEVMSVDIDISDINAVDAYFKRNKGIDVLYHLAAIVPTETVCRNKLKALQVNSLGAAYIAQAVAESSPHCHVIHVSSSHVYEPSSEKLDENRPTKPQTFYGITKLLAEKSIETICLHNSLKYTIARVFSVWDEEQSNKFLYGNLLHRLKSHNLSEVFELNGGESLRNFSHSKDVAHYLKKILEMEIIGIVNVGDDKNSMSVRDFAQNIGGAHLKIQSIGEANTLLPLLDKFNTKVK